MNFARTAAMAALALSLLAAAPVRAQSAGYNFLQAVEKREDQKVEAALAATTGTPGNIIINSQKIDTGDTALHILIARRDLTWMQYFLAKGANPNLANFKGTTPLWLAVNTGFTDGAELLILRGAQVNGAGPAGVTPLIEAVQRKDQRLVKALIAAGADPLRADSSGRNAVDYANLVGKGPVLDDVTAAANKAKAKKKTYGPSF